MIKIIAFKIEYAENPIGLVCSEPCFSWRIESDNAFPQSDYRLIVSSSEKKALSREGDLYDSGTVVSAETIGIRYKGVKLAPRQKCYVRVFVTAGGERAESGISTFEMSLLSREEWQGNWMSMPVNHQGGTALFRKKITLEAKKIGRARAYVCGLGCHELFVNGVKAGRAVLNPSVTEYSERLLYCVYDITAMVSGGDNVVGIEVGHGWFGAKKVLANFYFDYEDGETAVFHSSTNGGWWVSGSPTVDNSIYGGEVYDARLEDKYPLNWATTDFEPAWDNGWMFTIFSAAPKGTPEPQQIEPIEVCALYPAVSIVKKNDTTFVADVGRNIAGWARIKVRGKRGASITLKFGERLTDGGFVNRLNLRSARASDTYILRGGGIEEYAPRFTYHGFQYVQAEIEGECELISLTGEHVHNATRQTGSFNCSDVSLNALHANAVVTEWNNQHGILTDCPQRDERFGWLNDLSSRLYQTVYNCGMELFFRKFTRDITHTRTGDGAIGDTAPFFTGGRPADPVCIAYLLMPYYSYMYYGDDAPARAEYDGLKGWTDYLLSRSNDFIMDYSYYADWVAPACFNEQTDKLYVSTVYLFWHLSIMSRIAAITGNEPDRAHYARLAGQSKAKINEVYFNGQTCNYGNGTQAANSLALSLKLVPREYCARIAANIFKDVQAKGFHSSCGNIGYRHLFYVLGDYGYADAVVKILKNPEYPGWGYMLANGATSVWERWESEMSNEMDSFNHPMFGSYDAFFYGYLGGIKVDEDAFACDKITLSPVTDVPLSFVECSFETVRGKIVSNWKKENGKIKHHFEIPPSIRAVIKAGGREFEASGTVDFEF